MGYSVMIMLFYKVIDAILENDNAILENDNAILENDNAIYNSF